MPSQEELRKQYEIQTGGVKEKDAVVKAGIMHDPQEELRKQYEMQTSTVSNPAVENKQNNGLSVKSVLSGLTDSIPVIAQYKKGLESASQLSDNINPNNEYISALKQSIIKSNPITDTYSKAPELFSQDVNSNSGDVSDAGQASIKDSLVGTISDYYAGKKGGSGYKMHDKSWSTEAFSDPQKAKDVINDLTYTTGTMIADLPVILGLSMITPNPVFVMGGLSALKSMATQKRDTGEIKAGEVAKEGLIGTGEGAAFYLAGGASKNLTRLIGQKIGVATKAGASPLYQKAVEAMAGTTGMTTGTVGMTAAGMKARGESLDDLGVKSLQNITSGALFEAGVKAGKASKRKSIEEIKPVIDESIADRTLPEEQRAGLIDKIVDDHIKYNVDAFSEYVKEHPEYKTNLSKDQVVNLAIDDIIQSMEKNIAKGEVWLNEKKSDGRFDELYQKKADEYRTLSDPQAKEYLYSEIVKRTEAKTGIDTGLLDENGVFKDKDYFLTSDEIKTKQQDLMNELSFKWNDAEGFKKGFEGENNLIEQHIELSKLKRITDAREQVLTKKTTNLIFPEQEKGKVYSRITDVMKSKITEEAAKKAYEENQYANPLTKDILKETLATTNEEVRRMADNATFAPLSSLEGWTSNFKNMPALISRLGKESYRFLYEPAREAEALYQRHLKESVNKTNEYGKALTKDERTQVLVEMLRKQVAKDSKAKSGFSNIGEGLVQEMLDDGKISQSKHFKTYDEMSEKQKKFYDHISTGYADMWERANKTRAIKGLEEIPGLPDYMRLALDKGRVPEFREMESWLIKKKLEGDTVLNKAHSVKRTEGTSELNIEPGDIFNSYAAFTEKVINLSPVAQKWVEYANALEPRNPQMAELIRTTGKFWAGEVTDMTPWARRIHAFNNSVTGALLSFSVNTMLTQPTSLANTIAEFGYSDTIDAISRVIKEDKYNKTKLDDVDSAVLRSAIQDISVFDLESSSNKKNWLTQQGFKGMKATDLFMRKVTYEVAYDKYIQQGLDNKTAKFYADEMVNKTQASGSRLDVSKIQRNAVGKLLTTFQTFSIGNLNYLAQEIFGADPIYELANTFDTRQGALDFIKGRKGYDINRIEVSKGKTQYVAYEKQSMFNTLDAIKKVFYLSTFYALVNSAFAPVEDLTKGVIKSPLPSPVNAYIKATTGRSFDDRLWNTANNKDVNKKGFNKYNYDIVNGVYQKVPESKYRKGLRVAADVATEFAKPIPLFGGAFSRGSGMEGAMLGMANRPFQDFQMYKKSGSKTDLAAIANDLTVFGGNPFYQLGRYAIKSFREINKAAIEDAQNRKAYDGGSAGLKSRLNRGVNNRLKSRLR